jgi:hypothetical protein
MFRLRALVVVLPLAVLVLSCSFRGPAERAQPGVPVTAPVARLPRPIPPRIYRLGHLDTLVQVPGRVLPIHQASRGTYERLPQPIRLPVPPASAEEEEAFDFEAEERNRLRTAGKSVRRLGKALWLYPTAAKALQLRNNPADNPNTNISYEYLATLPAIRQWLVAVHLYEGGYSMLVDQRTGRRTRVWSAPAVAPDGRHFVCGNSDVLARYEPSGLQLWSVEGSTLRLLWERQTEWGCTQPRWLDNKTILFEQDFFDNGDVDTRVVRLTVVP